MPLNKFSGSVDEILENIKQQQSDLSDLESFRKNQAVDNILANLKRQADVAAETRIEPKPPAAEPKQNESAELESIPVMAAAEPEQPELQEPEQEKTSDQSNKSDEQNPAAIDEEFEQFFSESIAVIPNQEDEKSGFFARIRQRKKDAEPEEGEIEIDVPELTEIQPETTEIQIEEPDQVSEESELEPQAELIETAQQPESELEQESVEIEEDEGTEQEDQEPAGLGHKVGSLWSRLFGGSKKSSRWLRMFGSKEPADVPEEKEPTGEYIEDYEDHQDASDVQASLSKMRMGLILRTAISGILALAVLYLGLLVDYTFLPPIVSLDPALSTSAWLSVQLMLLVAAGAVNWRVFTKGIPGIWGSPTQDTISALACIAAAAQLVGSLMKAKSFDPEGITLFVAPAAILLFCNALGRLLMSGVILRGFQLVSNGEEHTAAALVNDRELSIRLAKDMGEPEPCLLASRPTGLVQGFLKHSFSVRTSDVIAQKLSWVLLGGAAVSGVIGLATGKGLELSITAFAGTICLGAPLAATLLSAVPALLMQRSAAQVGAVVPGWSAVSQLGKANMVVASAKDLFPNGSVLLHSIKTFDKQRIDLAILYAASVLIDGCDTLRDVFLPIIQNRTDILYPVENLENHPGLGFTAWVDNNRMIVGNRAMMIEQGVEVPSLDYENRYTKDGTRYPVYLAVSGQLFAMFMVSYHADRHVAETLRTLRRQGISVMVRSDDFNLNSVLVTQVYHLREGCLKVLSPEERKLLESCTSYQSKTEGCMIHQGSFASFVGGLTAAAGASGGEKAASLVQAAGVLLSCILALMLSFTGGLAQLSLPAVILYGLAWGVLTLAMPLFRRYE